MEHIGADCFQNSGVQEITLPGTLREISANTFNGYQHFRTMLVEKGCKLWVKRYVGESVAVRRK